jgi:hypothetical protein
MQPEWYRHAGYPFNPWLRSVADPLIHIPRIDHRWAVFAPTPEPNSWRVSIPAHLRSHLEANVTEPMLNLFALRGYGARFSAGIYTEGVSLSLTPLLRLKLLHACDQ